MALFTRVSRLLRADLHAVLDRIEEPEALLRQAVREMDEELAGERRAARRTGYEIAQIAARLTEHERAIGRIDDELDACFEAGKDDLVRALIRRKLEARRAAHLLGERHQRLSADLAASETRLAENQARLDAMRQKAEVLAACEEDRDEARFDLAAGHAVSDDEVEVAFLREQRRRAPA